MNTVYEVRFTLADNLKTDTSLSTEVKANTAIENQKQEKLEETTSDIVNSKQKNIAAGITTALGVAAKSYATYLEVRNVINSYRVVNMGIRGDVLSAKALQIQTAKNDAVIGYIQSAISPAITGALAGFVSGGATGAVGGAIVGLGVGVVSVIKDLTLQSFQVQAQQNAYYANQELKNYINNLERQKLIANVGYYR